MFLNKIDCGNLHVMKTIEILLHFVASASYFILFFSLLYFFSERKAISMRSKYNKKMRIMFNVKCYEKNTDLKSIVGFCNIFLVFQMKFNVLRTCGIF